ncbi:hypothetical protein [Lysinibacillus xylanilyticus]|uniref:hypothetical protein n=1 Tax=Lysinibacillus xylanilyticus TaxID=582475 RepID=UPI003D061FDC
MSERKLNIIFAKKNEVHSFRALHTIILSTFSKCFVAKATRQKTPTSKAAVMNADMVPFQGIQTSTEIEELSLRKPRLVATTE